MGTFDHIDDKGGSICIYLFQSDREKKSAGLWKDNLYVEKECVMMGSEQGKWHQSARFAVLTKGLQRKKQ